MYQLPASVTRCLAVACFLSAVSISHTSAQSGHGSPVALISTRVAGVSVSYIAIRLYDPRVHVHIVTSNGFPNGDESFGSMVNRLQPLAAINGAYFSKTTHHPIGDIVIDGHLVHQGMMGTALAIDEQGNPMIRRVTWGHASDWSAYKTVLCCGPALVLNGVVDVHPEQEGFRDPHVMGATGRMAIGFTPDRHLLLVKMAGSLTFTQEANVMKALGCHGAMNLDAGASTGMYYQGRYLATPGRKLTNIITVSVR